MEVAMLAGGSFALDEESVMYLVSALTKIAATGDKEIVTFPTPE
jgi:hypothetical protein